jgi:hypothetical protein
MRTEIHIDWNQANPSIRRKWYITSDSGHTFDAFDVATQCITKWMEFFNVHESKLNVSAARLVEDLHLTTDEDP